MTDRAAAFIVSTPLSPSAANVAARLLRTSLCRHAPPETQDYDSGNPNQLSRNFRVDDANPEATVPSNAQRARDPPRVRLLPARPLERGASAQAEGSRR